MLKIPKPENKPEMPEAPAALLTFVRPSHKEILTITRVYNETMFFDDEVNRYLREGWKLKRRDMITPHNEQNPFFYAELERDVLE